MGDMNNSNLNDIYVLNSVTNISPTPYNGGFLSYNMGEKYNEIAENYGIPIYEIYELLAQYNNNVDYFHTSLFDYKNLPKNLDKFKLERKILNNGYVAIINFLGDYECVNCIFNTFDMYNNGITGKIIEPFNKVLNGLPIEDFKHVIIRNNMYKNPNKIGINVWIDKLIKALSKLTINLEIMKPNAIMADTGDIIKNEDNKNSLEKKLHSKNIFHVWKRKKNNLGKPNTNLNLADQEVFNDIALKTYSEELIAIFNFIKEQYKELIGCPIGPTSTDHERLITAEIDNTQTLSVSVITNMLEIRKIDIENLNDTFNLDVSIELKNNMDHKDLKNKDENKEETT